MRHSVPADQLPGFGDWDGPIHGELGVLESDGERLQCHACGRLYKFLASHIVQAHGLMADEYRAIFGLRRTTRLAAPSVRSHMSNASGPRIRQYALASPLKTMSSEERSRYARGRDWRLEARMDPANRQAWQGPWHQKSGARMRELVADPEYKAEFAHKVSQAKGGRVNVTCAICGTAMQITHSRFKEGSQRTCSRACFREFRRRNANKDLPRPEDVVLRISQHMRGWRGNDYQGTLAKLQALGAATFGLLSERDGDIIRLYYGLAGQRPLTYRELKTRFGLSAAGIHYVLREGVAKLLGLVPSAAERDALKHARMRASARKRRRPLAKVMGQLTAEAFERLSDPERSIIRRYYGLDDGQPWSLTELAADAARSEEWVRRRLERAAVQLLGRHLSDAVERCCVVCGTLFTPESYRSPRRTCSEPCRQRAILDAQARAAENGAASLLGGNRVVEEFVTTPGVGLVEQTRLA